VLGVNQAKFNAMLRSISDDIALIDIDLNILWTNAAAKDIYGDNIIGKKCYEVYHRRKTPYETQRDGRKPCWKFAGTSLIVRKWRTR
jgi:hypothetical protein